MPRKRIGTIIVPPGVFIMKHEKVTADFLATKLGYCIEFLAPDRHKSAKTPDLKMNECYWEIKSPRGKSSRTIENNLRSALRQSPNIVLDLRRMDGRVPTKKLVDKAVRQFSIVKPIQRIIVITRQETHIDLRR